jgi:hypothetical protein
MRLALCRKRREQLGDGRKLEALRVEHLHRP